MSLLTLAPCDVRFSQDSICRHFRGYGGNVNEAIRKIKQGIYTVGQFPRIEVVSRGGAYFTLDNRRLYVFRVLQVEGYLDTITVYETQYTDWYRRKFTTFNEGESIRVRGDVTHTHVLESSQKSIR